MASPDIDRNVVRWGRSTVLALAGALVLSLSACASIPDDAWVVEPIRYNNALDGEDRVDMIDVTYSMGNLTGDTAGGFWTESAGSWLHVNGDGVTARRFNFTAVIFSTVHGIAAASPTELVVSHDQALSRFDTETQTTQRIPTVGEWIGDVAVVNDSILYVEYAASSVVDPRVPWADPVVPTPFVIRKLDASGALSTLTPTDEELLATDVEIDADRAGNVYVVTESEKLVLDPTGSVTFREEHGAEHPFVAVNSDGELLWPSGSPPAELDWRIRDGSAEARAVVDEYSACAEGGVAVAVDVDGAETVLPFLCGANSAAWLDDGSFVLVAGTELGTVLARITRPQLAPGASPSG